MRIEEIRALAAGGESTQIEFKRSTGQRSDGAKAVCGMLNGSGGFVFFGIADDGTIVGQEIGRDTLEDVVAELRRIEPQMALKPEAVPVTEERSVIVVSVPGGTAGPFMYDGRAYVRQGPTTIPMPQEEYKRKLLEQMQPGRRWETQPADGLTMRDLDHAEITRTVDEAVRRGRLDDPGTRNPVELLTGLKLLKDGEILNGAVVLFAQPDQLLPSYPQCQLKMARFRGTTTREFEDNRQLHGNAFLLLQSAQRFLRDHLPIAGRVVPDLFERQDDPLYPPEALREALVNALCHRDYQIGGGSVSIGIFDDRLEISSTGRLPFGLSVEDLVRTHPSRPWNPLIADVFFRRGLMEQWGRGTLRITELTEQAGLAAPEFEERGGELVVRFFPTAFVPPRRIDHPLTEVQQRVLAAVAEIGPARLGFFEEELPDLARETIQKELQNLRSFGLVEVRGWARGAKWRLSGR